MGSLPCNHKNMQEILTTEGVTSRCPDCGITESASTEEVAEITQEVLEDIDQGGEQLL